MDRKLEQGESFKLCIFPSSSASVILATWEGIQRCLEDFYPKVWPKIETHYVKITQMDIESVEQEADYNMEEANWAGQDPVKGESLDENYMSLQRFQKIREPSLVQVRQFLWVELD